MWLSEFCAGYIFRTAQLFVRNLVWLYIRLRWSVVRRDWFAIFRVKVITRASIIKIQLQMDPFTTRLDLMVCYHVPEHLVKRSDCCGQVHSEIQNFSKCLLPYLLKSQSQLLQWKLVWWCIALRQRVLWKDWFPIPMLYDTVRTGIIKTWLYHCCFFYMTVPLLLLLHDCTIAASFATKFWRATSL